MLPLRENRKRLLKKLHNIALGVLRNWSRHKRKKALQICFIFIVVFAMFFSEFVLAIASPNRTLQAYAYFLDNNVGGNGVANALGKLTITEKAHLLIKGSGHYVIKIVDSQDTVLFSKVGDFNKTGYAEVIFTLSPSKFRVGESYYAYITAEDNPFPLLYRRAEVKIPFKIHKDYPVIGLGAVRDGNQTLITARILTGAGPLRNKKIWFAYKIYNANETPKTPECTPSDNDGRAVLVTNALNDSRMYLIVAEFYGDDMYMPVAASQAYLPMITAEDYSRHDALMNVLNTRIENNYASEIQVKKKASVKYGKIGRAVLSSMSYKTAMTVGERFKKVTASDRIKSNNSDYKFKFTEEDLASLSLVEFLKRITTDDTPASALINIANILMNLNNVPFVLEQTQELLSKLQVPLVPDVAHSSLTEIRLYRTKTYVVNVEKTVAEKHVETYTVTKKVSKKVKYTEKITKKIKVRVQYIYYQKIVRKEMAFVRRPRPHWQIVYVVTYKPVVKWKYVWKNVKQTVTRYKTVTYTVTEKKTRTYYTYKTVTEKVKKEKREYFRILITKGFTVINEQTNEKMTLQQFFLFVMGFREDALGQIINYLEAKVFGPALNILQQFIDFLISVSKRFLRTLVEKLFEEIKSLAFQGLMLHMVKYSSNSRNDKKDAGNKTNNDKYIDYLYISSGEKEKYRLERADRPYNIWDTLYKLHAPRAYDIAESTKLTIELSVLEAKAEYFITGDETAVVIPVTSETLVYNTKYRKNNEPNIGWLDLNHYDHTIAKYDKKIDVYDWRHREQKKYNREMGYIPLGVTRTTYIILLPDTTSADGRKVVIAYSLDIIDDKTKLVPDALKDFPELAQAQKIRSKKARKINESFNKELKYLKENVLETEYVETYGDLREIIANKENVNIQELIKSAVENSKVSGISVGEVESGGTKSQFFIINKDYKWTDSDGTEHTPVEINCGYFITETGNDSKYKESARVLVGLVGEKNYKGPSSVEEQFADIPKGKNVAEKIFERVCDIAKTNDIPANGVLRVISPSLLDKVGDIRIIGESDEFQNNNCAITIVDPTLANPIAILYLDYFRAFAEHEYSKALDSLGINADFKISQIRIFRESIIDAYRIAILFHKNPEEIKFKLKYRDGHRIENTEFSLAFLMEHVSEFAVVGGSNVKRLHSIKINGKDIPVDKIVEGFMHLRVEQDNKNHKVILQPLDDNLNPITSEKVTFDFQETKRVSKGRKRIIRHILFQKMGKNSKKQKMAIATLSLNSASLIHETLYVCFEDMFRETFREDPELESKFVRLLGDAEHLGQNPAKSAAYLVFFLLQETKGREATVIAAKRYMITILRHERKLTKLKNELDKLLNDPKRLSTLTVEELKALKDTYHKIETELKNLRTQIILLLEAHFNSINNAKKHENKIIMYMEITRRYLEKLLGGKEGVKRISKNIAIGTLVGLIFPRVVAETIMTLDMSILEEVLARDAKTFIALMSNKELQLGIGLSLSAITFALLNLDIHRFMKAGTTGTTRNAGTAGTSSHVNHNTHKSSIIGEFFGQLFDVKMIFATFLSGFGMLLKALANAPFYTTEEIAEEISKQVHEKLGETAGVIWDMTAGYRIPGLDMTGFEVALTILLQGNSGVIQLVTTVVTKAVEYLLSEVIKPFVEPIIAEYTYYIVDALSA